MPQDTLWLNDVGENFLIYDHSQITDSTLLKNIQDSITAESIGNIAFSVFNNLHNDSLLQTLISFQTLHEENKFLHQKEYYDGLSSKIELLIILAFFILIFYAVYRRNKKQRNPYSEDDNEWIEIGSRRNKFYTKDHVPAYKPTYSFLTYKGKDLNFSEAEITAIFTKRFHFFIHLSSSEKIRFLNRHKKFMKNKTFRIHDRSGFKEMPVLISATAIQLSFGLEEYLLPHYKCINIYPEEFLGVHPTIRFLEGNVSGDTINISWKHYLQGYNDSSNGQNVGLHEMAHAYYCQNIICEQDRDQSFLKSYNNFHTHGDIVFKIEQEKGQGLYTDYALKNLQEFWAESVEIFFERPALMKDQYPDLYNCMKVILNQTTA